MDIFPIPMEIALLLAVIFVAADGGIYYLDKPCVLGKAEDSTKVTLLRLKCVEFLHIPLEFLMLCPIFPFRCWVIGYCDRSNVLQPCKQGT
jgi:hypothetical protein